MAQKRPQEIIQRMSLTVFFINSAIIIVLSLLIFNVINSSIQQATLLRLKNIAYLWAKTIDGDAFLRLRNSIPENLSPASQAKIENSEDFKKIYEQINAVRRADAKIIKYVYTFVPTSNKNEARFVVDGDFFLDQQNQKKSITHFGEPYDISDQPITKKAITEDINIVDENFFYDAPYNTTVVTGFAPIYDSNHDFVGTFWVDISDENLAHYAQKTAQLLVIFTLLAILVALWVSIKLKHYLISVGFIIEAKKELEESLHKQQELDRQKTNFINTASHELRTPLTVMHGYLSMVVEGDFWEVSDEIKKYMKIAEQNATYLLSLVNDMLDISKMDAGKEKFVFEEFSLTQAIERIVGNAEIIGKNKGIQIINDYQLSEQETIYSCKNALFRVLVNIIGNAVKFTHQGGFIKITTKKDATHYTFVIEDSGVGIAKEDFEKIFEKFGQVGNSLNKENKGTGLGLYIVKRNVEALGGEIFLDSQVGVGTTFTIVIPIVPPVNHEHKKTL